MSPSRSTILRFFTLLYAQPCKYRCHVYRHCPTSSSFRPDLSVPSLPPQQQRPGGKPVGGAWLPNAMNTHLGRLTTHLGRLTLTVPTGTISKDLPQNLFFHFMSGGGLGEGEGEGDVRPESVPAPTPRHVPFAPTSTSPCPPRLTLPEDEVLGLCVARRDRGVVGDLGEQRRSLDSASEDPGVCSRPHSFPKSLPPIPSSPATQRTSSFQVSCLCRPWPPPKFYRPLFPHEASLSLFLFTPPERPRTPVPAYEVL